MKRKDCLRESNVPRRLPRGDDEAVVSATSAARSEETWSDSGNRGMVVKANDGNSIRFPLLVV